MLPLNNNYFHCTFTVVFTTIEDYAAITDKEYIYKTRGNNIPKELISGDYRIPLVDEVFKSSRYPMSKYKSIRLFNPHSYPYYPRINIKQTFYIDIGINDLKNPWKTIPSDEKDSVGVLIENGIDSNTNKLYYYNLEQNGPYGPINIDGRLGFATLNDELVERELLDKENTRNFINNGVCEVLPGNIERFDLKLTKISNGITADTNPKEIVILTFESNDENILSKFDYGQKSSSDLLLENPNNKAVFIQKTDVLDYQLYSEKGYTEGGYYVNPAINY